MGGDSTDISYALFSATSSPRPSTDPKITEPIWPPNPVTPNLRGSRKRSAPSPMSNPEHEPPTQKRRAEEADDWSLKGWAAKRVWWVILCWAALCLHKLAWCSALPTLSPGHHHHHQASSARVVPLLLTEL